MLSKVYKIQTGTRKRKCRSAGLSAAALALVAALTPAPAVANYSYPYFYAGLGSLLYPLSYIAYPIFGRVPTSTYYAPYWIQRGVQRTLTGAYGYPAYGGNAYLNQGLNGQPPSGAGSQNNGTANPPVGSNLNDPSNNPYGQEDYTDEEPVTEPRKRKRPKRVPATQGVDQVAHASMLDPAAPDAALLDGPHAPGVAPPITSHPKRKKGKSSPDAETASSTGYEQSSATSSQTVGASPVSLPPARNLQQAATCAPLAEGFVNHVNSKYNGDIKAALFDPQTRSYARILGLVNDDSLFQTDLSESRVQLVKQIMQDSSLDSVSKLQAIKIMIGSRASR